MRMSRTFAAFIVPMQTLLLGANAAERPNPGKRTLDFRAKPAGGIGYIEGCT
jgi:hypothetical protein